MQTTYGHTKRYLTRGGQPWLPVMGEMHYSRYPRAYWREAVLKMKAGGVDIVACYAFWNHHEREEGAYTFEDTRDVKQFLRICQEEGMLVFLRIGPWCHGEVRNGGFPDWLCARDWKLRSNDARYLAAVRAYWTRLYGEAKAYLHPAGNVIGIQIENEYMSSGDGCGRAHMLALEALAKEIGFVVPYYTATGWGGAHIGNALPVMGGYCDAPWDRSIEELPPNGNYIFSHERNDTNIGSDMALGEGLTFDPFDYPYLTAEIGGGLQPTYNRRPIASAGDIGAAATVKLGSGANLLGYYMYHGGTNPEYGLQETRKAGNYCELAELNYDFQAPIGEYGQISETYRELRLLSMFVNDFGAMLAPMETIVPKDNPSHPADLVHLRCCWRTDGTKGFLFFNNYQRRRRMAEQVVSPVVPLPGGCVSFPEITLRDGDYGFYPFHMPIGSATLKTATATPLCILNGRTYVFYADTPPRYELEGTLGDAEIMTITREEAKSALKVQFDKEYLLISDAPAVQTKCGVRFFARADVHISAYPALPRTHMENGWTVERVPYPEAAPPQASVVQKGENCLLMEYEIRLENIPEVDDVFLDIQYEGTMAELYLDGRKVADEFYRGAAWQVGLRRFAFAQTYVLRIYALESTAPVYLECEPVMENGFACRLKGVFARCERVLDWAWPAID